MCAAPFLYPLWLRPLTLFYHEWLAFVLGLAACFVFFQRGTWKSFTAPKIAQHILLFVALIAIQSLTIPAVYTSQYLVPALYLCWAALLMVLTTWLREQLGLEKLVNGLAWFMLAGGILQALAGVFQYLDITQWSTGLVHPANRGTVVFGNLGQQNHFATHVAFGLLALLFLSVKRRLGLASSVPIAVLFVFVIVLSGSRMIALAILGICILSGFLYYREKNETHLRLFRMSIGVLALYILAQYLLPAFIEWLALLGFDASHLRTLTARERGMAGIEGRLHEWSKSWHMFLQAPLLGVGMQHYAWHSFTLQETPQFSGHPNSQLFHNAHNLFMHVMAELGVVGLLLLLYLLFSWLRQFLSRKLAIYDWFIAAVLLVLFIHSNTEFPLWFSYFLGIAAIFFTLGDNRSVHISFTPVMGQIATMGILLLSGAILAMTFQGYRYLTDVNRLIVETGPETAAKTLLAISKNPILTPWAEIAMTYHGVTEQAHIAQQLDMTTRVMHLYPDPGVLRRQVIYLALAGNMDESLSLLRRVASAYEPIFPMFVCSLQNNARKEIMVLADEARSLLREPLACP